MTKNPKPKQASRRRYWSPNGVLSKLAETKDVAGGGILELNMPLDTLGSQSERLFSLAQLAVMLGFTQPLYHLDEIPLGESIRHGVDRLYTDDKAGLDNASKERCLEYLSGLGGVNDENTGAFDLYNAVKLKNPSELSPKYVNFIEQIYLDERQLERARRLAGVNSYIGMTALRRKKLMENDVNVIIEQLRASGKSNKKNTRSKSDKGSGVKIQLDGTENYRYVNLEPDAIKRKAMLKALKKDIIFFVRKVFGTTPTQQQVQLLRAFEKHGAKITVKSGHSCGKSTTLAWIIIHSLLFEPNVRILCTAPSSSQMHDVLWAELRLWQRRMENKWWKDQIRITNGRASFSCGKSFKPGDNDDMNRFATAKTAKKERPDALQGVHTHSGTMIVIVDEAAAVDNAIFESASGSLAGKRTKVVLTGNPTDISPDNYFYKTHHVNKRFWTCLHFSALDSPLADKDWCETVKNEYGEDSPYYSVRVLGEFPKVSDDTLIPLYYVESAYGRIMLEHSGERIAGLDPGRSLGGDATGFVMRQGNEIYFVDQWHSKDAMYTASRVADHYKNGEFDILMVDSIGLGGPIADRMRQLIGKDKVIEVNVSERIATHDKYAKLRDELWFACRTFFESMNVSINTEKVEKRKFEVLMAELTTIKYEFRETDGRLKVQAKKDMKKSPNIADALNLTFARDVVGETGMYSAGSNFTGKAREIVVQQHGAFLG